VTAAPAGASTLVGIRSVASGADVSCAVLIDTTARCWGFNLDGQIGDGTHTERHVPTVVQNGNGTGPLRNVAQITVGTSHVCALIKDGTARCWGEGGELGDGTNLPRSRPVIVKNLTGSGPLTTITQINAGGHQTCARLTDGTARCWGMGGALGNGHRSSRLPVKVLNPAGTAPLTSVTQISVGDLHSCARIADGTARCWGVNTNGDLGDRTTFSRFLPVKVLNLTGPQTRITQIVASYYHTCARISDGTARCWGFNGDGQLGDGTQNNRARPVTVLNRLGNGPLTGVTAITAGAHHSCAHLADGTARCWGKRLATGDANNSPSAAIRLLPA
jgi:alpha-tubulin suppressor-like RCC1 family protein